MLNKRLDLYYYFYLNAFYGVLQSSTQVEIYRRILYQQMAKSSVQIILSLDIPKFNLKAYTEFSQGKMGLHF